MIGSAGRQSTHNGAVLKEGVGRLYKAKEKERGKEMIKESQGKVTGKSRKRKVKEKEKRKRCCYPKIDDLERSRG